MRITKKILAKKIIDFLYHKISLLVIVDWAENVLMESEFDDKDEIVLKNITAFLGVSDIKSFGLTLDECQSFLNQLGYKLEFEVRSFVIFY